MTETAPHAFMPRPLRILAARVLETALNQALALDPDTRAGLGELEGRRLQLHLRGPEWELAVHVRHGKLRVELPGHATEAVSSLRVSATPGNLLGMALRGGDDAVAPGKVDISGDADLARRLEKLARGYAPDIERAFVRVFGEIVGVPLARAFLRAFSHLRDSGHHLLKDSADWVREEARLGVSAAEMDTFLDAVDELRERVERLQARTDRLHAGRGTHP